MTREEAIKWIIYEKESIDTEGYCATKENYARIQALDIAIEVLSVKDCHGCTHYDLLQTPVICHDCSRAYKDRYKDEKGTLDDMFTESAEAYKAWTGEEMGKTHGRLIDADALYKKATVLWDKSDSEDFEKGIFKLILNAPTVSADRPTGEWITQDNGAFYPYECSNCHEQPFCDDYGYHLTNFCPNCGADMRGEKDEY